MAAQTDSLGDPTPDRPGWWPLLVEVDRPDLGAGATVKIRGEIDLATAPALQQRLDTLLDEGVDDVILDLGGVPFVDVPGLKVLMRVQSQLGSRGGKLTVLRPCRPLRIMAAVLGLSDGLHLMAAPGPGPADRGDRGDEDGTAMG